MSKRAAEIALVIGLIAFCIWAFYAFAIAICLIGGISLLAIAAYNMMSGGGLVQRNDAGRRRERRVLFAGLGSTIFGIFIWGVGRDQLGAIGGMLIVIIIMMVIIAGLLGYPLGDKKKKS